MSLYYRLNDLPAPIGTAGAIQFPIVGMQPFQSMEQLGPLVVFIVLQVFLVVHLALKTFHPNASKNFHDAAQASFPCHTVTVAADTFRTCGVIEVWFVFVAGAYSSSFLCSPGRGLHRWICRLRGGCCGLAPRWFHWTTQCPCARPVCAAHAHWKSIGRLSRRAPRDEPLVLHKVLPHHGENGVNVCELCAVLSRALCFVLSCVVARHSF